LLIHPFLRHTLAVLDRGYVLFDTKIVHKGEAISTRCLILWWRCTRGGARKSPAFGEGRGRMPAEDRHGEVATTGACTDCGPGKDSFDELARGLANGTLSRRNALRLLGSALLGSVMASIPGVAWAHHKPDHPVPPGQARRCPHGEVKCRGICCSPEDLCCNGVCTNIVFDRNNCGACDNVCQEGEDCCGERCVPLNTRENCGCCGCACLASEECAFVIDPTTSQGHYMCIVPD
jgi:hypothetical protein